MTRRLLSPFCWLTMLGLLSLGTCPVQAADQSADVAAVQSSAEAFLKAFNDGKAEAVVALFLPEGELVDEDGNVYQGKEDLQKLFSGYFTKFPDATLSLDLESIRVLGSDLAVEEGTRYLSSKEAGKAQVRYTILRTKKDGKWLIASIREFYDDPLPTSGQRLAALDWMIGDWVSEETDLAVKISYRWAEDKNFILGDFLASRGGEVVMKSTQRIGWDPLAGKVRSWLFDSDGGFAEGSWTFVDDSWVIKSQATMPDGVTGSATVTMLPKGNNQFTMRGTERLIGEGRAEDFDITVTRAPPSPKEKAAAGSTPKAPAPATKSSTAPSR